MIITKRFFYLVYLAIAVVHVYIICYGWRIVCRPVQAHRAAPAPTANWA